MASELRKKIALLEKSQIELLTRVKILEKQIETIQEKIGESSEAYNHAKNTMEHTHLHVIDFLKEHRKKDEENRRDIEQIKAHINNIQYKMAVSLGLGLLFLSLMLKASDLF